MYVKVVRRIPQQLVDFHQDGLQDSRQLVTLLRCRLNERMPVLLWQDVNFVRHPSRKRYIGDELFVLDYHAIALGDLNQHGTIGVVDPIFVIEQLIHLAAPDTALSVLPVLLCMDKLALQHIRYDGSSDYLLVRVRQRGSSRLSVVLENQNVLELGIALQVDVALPPAIHYARHLLQLLMLQVN